MSIEQDEIKCLERGAWWWWRHIDEICEGERGRTFRYLFATEYLTSAYRYELAARINGSFEHGKHYLALSHKQRDTLALRWPMRTGPGGYGALCEGRPERSSEIKPVAGWSDFQFTSWNLNRNDEELVSQFRRMLRSQRVKHGVWPRRNQGRSNRPVSWRPIELLDLRRLKIRTLNESERSQISKAVKAFKASI